MAQREEMEFGVDGSSSCPTYFLFTAVHLLMGFIFDCSSGDSVWKCNLTGNVFPVVNQTHMSPALNLILLCKSEDTG